MASTEDESIIEGLARGLFVAYQDHRLRDGCDGRNDEHPNALSFDAQPAAVQASCRAQASAIIDRFEALGLALCPADEADQALVVAAFDEQTLERFAVEEHARWASERARGGWIWGATYSRAQKTTPDLVPYEQLSEAAKEYDRQPHSDAIVILRDMGYCVVAEGYEQSARCISVVS